MVAAGRVVTATAGLAVDGRAGGVASEDGEGRSENAGGGTVPWSEQAITRNSRPANEAHFGTTRTNKVAGW